MKIYYIISRMSYLMHSEFQEILNWLHNGTDLDYYLSDFYYNKILNSKRIDIRAGSIYHELIFLKYIKEKKDISYRDVNWIYKEEMVILNEDLFIYKDNNWKKINDEKIHIMAIKIASNNPFWFLLDKLPNIKISFANKRKNYRLKWDKLEHLIDIYWKRKEYIWDFMLPLYANRSLEWIKRIFLLWKEITWKNTFILKWSYLSDNWRDIKLIEVDKIIEREDLLDYVYIKFISKVMWNRGSIYITDRYDCKKEYRFYVNRDIKTKKVGVYYLKHKIHLTKKENLLNKVNIQTWVALRVKWENWDLKNISNDFINAISYVLKNISDNSWTIEFIEENNWNIRFLEINDLWDSFVKSLDLEEAWEKWIYWILDNIFYK